MSNISRLYRHRFREDELAKRQQVWRVLCRHYFQPLIGDDKVVLDLGCGYGEFINNINARTKYAVDLNPDSPGQMNPDVLFVRSPASSMPEIPDGGIDVVFTSNFLEHLKSKDECDAVFAEVLRLLKRGGRFVVLGPNIRYLAAEYWDFYDHSLPLSHLSLEEGMVQAGYEIESIIPRFLPYTMRSWLPQHEALVKLYLRMPPVWPLFGKQFLGIARKPA